ncbi:MAG: hypothetical protein HY302_09740 [Opitutae bacterium]|nr:hypothetical protein [Opitutae bacterium]
MKVTPGVRDWNGLRLGTAAVALVYLVSAISHVFFGALNPDEGFYAVAARAVMQGELPYRDFGYTQTPLYPYVDGALMRLTGFGLFEQRAINGVWGALALILAGVWLARRTRAWLGLLLVAVFSLSPAWMYFVHLGKTYAFTGFVVMVAAWVFLERPAGWPRTTLLGALGVVGVGCRLPAAPFFAVLWLASLLEGPGRVTTRVLGGGAVLVVFGAAALLPFYLAAPEASVFWTLRFHRLSVPHKDWQLAWQSIATLAPAVWVALLCALPAALCVKNALPRRERWVAGAALSALAANLLPAGVYEEYGVPFLLPLAAVAAAVLHRATLAETPARRRAPVVLVVAAGLAATPLLNFHYLRTPPGNWPSWWLPPGVPAYNPHLPGHLWQATRRTAALLAPGQPLIGPNIILAVETGRPVPRQLRMGPFAATAEFSPAVADRLHLATFPELEARYLDPRVPMLAFSENAFLNYSWSMPSFRNSPARNRARWMEIFRRDFLIVQQDGDFLLLARRSALPASTAR